MIIIISPAKKLDFHKEVLADVKYTTPRFLDRSDRLIKELRKLSPKDISVLMNVSEDIANLTFERHSKWKTPFDSGNAKPALFAFQGDVYRSMDAKSFSGKDLDYAQDHLRIMSGLYGVLRPLDLIQPYRLEMGIKLRLPGKKDLYGYWTETITTAINEELKKQNEKVLINLASQEYFKAVDTHNLDGEVITPVFKEFKDDKFKVVGILAKKARGLMSRFIIRNKPEKAEEIKHFESEGYHYDDNLSSGNEWVFTR
ncbi:MAG: peroxide stress protein YaaA [bacterium]